LPTNIFYISSANLDFTLLILAFIAYFLLAALLASLVFYPGLRAIMLSSLQEYWSWATRRGAKLSNQTAKIASNSTLVTKNYSIDIVSAANRHKNLLFLALAVLALPPLIAITYHRSRIFEFDEPLREPDPQIAALLRGEQLVPPPPLPPTVFTTKEVEQLRPKASGASRDWNLLDADFRQRLLLVYKIMREQHGYEMALIEAYRSPERQTSLLAIGDHVTKAGAFMSYHQFGLAADNAFFRNGQIVISEADPWAAKGYELYGKVAESVGLHWGGRWKLMDLGHVELKRAGVLGQKRS
jgi:peptidoglycan LD-endopeptidase CwlK